MPDAYRYIDPDSVYTDQETDVELLTALIAELLVPVS